MRIVHGYFLEKDVVLVSAVNKIEIWDKSRYTKFFESFSPESYSELANEVMNKKVEKPTGEK